MPSKANKRLAAAQKAQAAKSAAEALETETPEDSAPIATTTPATTTPATTTPAAATTTDQPQKLEIRSGSEEPSVPSAPASSRKDSESKEYAPLPPTSKLATLSKGTEQVTTNCYSFDITSKIFLRYLVNVTMFITDPEATGKPNRPAMTGSKGGDRKRQQQCSDIVLHALNKLGFKKPYAYDGATLLFVVDPLDNKKQSIIVEIESRELGDAARKTHFGKFTGHFVVEFSLNAREHKFNIADIFSEDLKNMTSGDKSLTTALQIMLAQEAKKSKKFSVFDGGSQIYSNAEKKPKGIPAGVVERDGIGSGVKIVVDRFGKPAVIVVLDYKKSYFFEVGPASNLFELAKKAGLKKFFRGIKFSTTFSSQTFSADGVSSVPIDQLTALGKPCLELCSETSNIPQSKFNKNLPAIQKIYNKTTKFYFAMETVQPLPNQKLAPHHGQPPRSAAPEERFRRTENLGSEAQILSANATLRAFGVEVIPNAITVMATKVDVPYIEYANNKIMHPDVNNKTSWQCNRFVDGATCNKVVIAFNGQNEQDAKQIVLSIKEGLMRNAENLGMKIKKDAWIIEDVSGTADQAKRKLLTIFESLKNTKTHLIYIDQAKELWSHGLLKLQERLKGVSSQQMNFGKSAKINTGRHTFTNVLLKTNLRLGGLNHRVKPKESIKHLWGAESNTLILSFDVCHSSGGFHGECEPSVVGFGYNVSPDRQKITGDFHYQPPRQEKVEADILESRAQSILETFMKAHNNVPPTNVIILRDGVSEGQYRMVLGHEVVAIERGFAVCLGKRKMPSIAVIVATKRHANRLYVKEGQRMENVPPFLAVDHTIVRKDANEILFVSHCPLNGTSQPLLLNVLKNNNVFKSNTEIVDLMSALCASHQASLNTVSLPETIYAADEYAKRGADLFAALPSCDLSAPRTESGIINYKELTKRLRYDTSVFKDRRMV